MQAHRANGALSPDAAKQSPLGPTPAVHLLGVTMISGGNDGWHDGSNFALYQFSISWRIPDSGSSTLSCIEFSERYSLARAKHELLVVQSKTDAFRKPALNFPTRALVPSTSRSPEAVALRGDSLAVYFGEVARRAMGDLEAQKVLQHLYGIYWPSADGAKATATNKLENSASTCKSCGWLSVAGSTTRESDGAVVFDVACVAPDPKTGLQHEVHVCRSFDEFAKARRELVEADDGLLRYSWVPFPEVPTLWQNATAFFTRRSVDSILACRLGQWLRAIVALNGAAESPTMRTFIVDEVREKLRQQELSPHNWFR